MSGFGTVRAALAPHGLDAVAGFHPGPGDGAPEGVASIVLVGADGARMWPVFDASPERADGERDPLDRWSARVIGQAARALGAIALFPFGPPPYHPFGQWAAAAEGSRSSPVSMPVSPIRGLWASYRGALGFAERLDLPPAPGTDPCLGCPAPCLTACPVEALTGEGYDVPRCGAHLASPDGAPCRDGCLVRAACPVGHAPPLEQRRFHMAAFARAVAPTPAKAKGVDAL